MLQIRSEQVHIVARETLVERLIGHAQRSAPEVCAAISASHLREVVDHCLERCQHHRLSRDYDVLRYLNLMLVYGVNFDKDEAWAAVPLAYRNPAGRMEMLMDHALQQHLPSPLVPEDAEEGDDE